MVTINEGQGERFNQDSIMLAALSKAAVYKDHGMARVLCGRDSAGRDHDEPNVAQDLRRLDEGRWIQLPDDINGGLRWFCLKAWVIVVSCDMPAAGSLVPYSDSAAAHRFCRCCNMDASNPDSKRPFSFLRRQESYQSDGQVGNKRRRLMVVEHDWDSLQQQIEWVNEHTTEAAREAYCKQLGLVFKRLNFAWDPRQIPFADPCIGLPQDVLHLFPDGLLRSEAAWLIYTLAKLGLSVDSINQAIASYSGWPPDVRIPLLSHKLTEGKEGGVPDSSSTLKMSGSQVMHFSLHR